MFAVMALTLVLTMFYVRHAWYNRRLPEDSRVAWIVAIVGVGILAMPVYWYRFLLRG